jgi:hypothetical protein
MVSRFPIAMLFICATAATSQATTVDLTPAADTYTAYWGGNGASTGLTFGNQGWANDSRVPFVRFDLAGINVSQITSASLALTITGGDSWEGNFHNSVDIYGYNDGGTNEAWTEGGLAAPLPGTSTQLGNAGGSVASGSVWTLSGASVVDFLKADTDGNVTFVFRGGNNDWLFSSFAAKEHATLAPATLSIVSSVPEPASLACLALGSMLMLRRRPAPNA